MIDNNMYRTYMNFLGFFMLIPIFFCFLYLTQDMVKEKDQGMRMYMNVIGVTNFSYW